MKALKVAYKNSIGSIINASIYESEGGYRIAGTCWSVGTFDPRFNYGPYENVDSAKKELDTLS